MMDELPDDVLVALLRRLSVPDVLACRPVCKRLADLALHRDVWRNRVLDNEEDPWSCTVLRLAPCLSKLDLKLPLKKPRICHVAYTTSCAAATLSLTVTGSGVLDAAFATRNQAALGRLRRVDICFYSAVISQASVLGVLLQTLASTPALEQLEVSGIHSNKQILAELRGLVLHDAVSAPSLKQFKCSYAPELVPFYSYVLAGHSATLQSVDINDHDWDDGESVANSISPSLAPLLAGLPNLKTLCCHLLPGMEALAACASLHHLDLDVKFASRPAVLACAALLRRATQLSYLSLYQMDGDCIIDPNVLDTMGTLVRTLGSSKKPCLDTLSLQCYGGPVNLSQALIDALPSLQALRVLILDGVDDELLMFLTPTVAPALRVLDVYFLMGCTHTWIHTDAVKAVLSTNPLLHIFLPDHNDICRPVDQCRVCSLGCHQILGKYSDAGLFSHDPAEKCSLDRELYRVNHIKDSIGWIHFPLKTLSSSIVPLL